MFNQRNTLLKQKESCPRLGNSLVMLFFVVGLDYCLIIFSWHYLLLNEGFIVDRYYLVPQSRTLGAVSVSSIYPIMPNKKGHSLFCCAMLIPIIKKGKELTPIEIEQLYKLHFKYQVDASPEAAHHHIIERHVQKMEVTFYLYKWEGNIVAYHASTWFKRKTPFAKKPLPIFHVNMTFKDATADEHIKNYGKYSNLEVVRQQLGRFWYLKPFVMTFNTINPKIIARLSKVFTSYYPNGSAPTPAVMEFAQQHLQEDLKIDPSKISSKLIIKDKTAPWMNISEDWQKHYSSASEPLNQFFIQEEIFKEEEGQHWLKVDNFAIFVGYYNPLKLLSSEIRQLLKW